MLPEGGFEDVIRRVRAGDEAAATELVERYQPAIRRAVRIRLSNSTLRSAAESADICQSVFFSFFVRAALGEYELQTPEQLLKLLVSMARNKLTDLVRRQHRQRRDVRRMEARDVERFDPVAADATPSRLVSAKELLDKVRQGLTAEGRQLADERASGRTWTEMAQDHGETPDALRKRLTRSLDQVLETLGWESVT